MSKLRTGIGIAFLVISAFGVGLLVREITTAIRFGGPSGGLIGGHAYYAAFFDGTLTAVLLTVGLFLVKEHLKRKSVIVTLAGVTCVMIVWGRYASYILIPD